MMKTTLFCCVAALLLTTAACNSSGPAPATAAMAPMPAQAAPAAPAAIATPAAPVAAPAATDGAVDEDADAPAELEQAPAADFTGNAGDYLSDDTAPSEEEDSGDEGSDVDEGDGEE